MMRARLLLAALALAALPAALAACPTCKDTLAADAQGQGFSRGVAWSIAVFLGLLFGLAGFFIRHLIRLERKRS